MRKHRRYFSYDQPGLSRPRARMSVGAMLPDLSHVQANVLNLVGVSHLFIVPRIRTSSYLEALVDKFPDLRSSPSGGHMQEPSLPELRNLIVVDNTGQFQYEAERLRFKSWIDWREIIVWDESASEAQLQQAISGSLCKDDVINLQFTRQVPNE